MRLPHAEPGVGARPAGILTQLVDEFFRQPVQVGPGELLIDAVVLCCAIFKGAGDRRDGVDSAEALIQGTLHCPHPLLPLQGSWTRPASGLLAQWFSITADRAVHIVRMAILAATVAQAGGVSSCRLASQAMISAAASSLPVGSPLPMGPPKCR